jgi:hypothetical protein
LLFGGDPAAWPDWYALQPHTVDEVAGVFGRNVLRFRLRRELSQRQLSRLFREKLDMRMPQQRISHYELIGLGDKAPEDVSLGTMLAFANVFDVPLGRMVSPPQPLYRSSLLPPWMDWNNLNLNTLEALAALI